MKLEDIDASHSIEEDDDAFDRHSPAWRCTTCRYASCSMCGTGDGLDDDELIAPCQGFPFWEEVHGLPEDMPARRAGTGWPSLTG